MLHPTRSAPERTPDDCSACRPPGAMSPRVAGVGRRLRRLRCLGLRWLRTLGAALARAEKRITENFRVPPHGG